MSVGGRRLPVLCLFYLLQIQAVEKAVMTRFPLQEKSLFLDIKYAGAVNGRDIASLICYRFNSGN